MTMTASSEKSDPNVHSAEKMSLLNNDPVNDRIRSDPANDVLANRIRQDQIRMRRKKTVSLESISEIKDDLLDMKEIHQAANELEIKTHDDEKKPEEEGYQAHPKMHTLVGFLRLGNYICACTVLFGTCVSLFVDVRLEEHLHWSSFWQEVAYLAAGWVQILYLTFVSLVMMVDSIGTVTFRWREYGELSHSQADATSVVFFLCKSRWVWRLASALVLSSSVSLRATRIMSSDEYNPHDVHWYLALCLVSLASCLMGFLFSWSPWHGVHWLRDRVKQKHIEDKSDVWVTKVMQEKLPKTVDDDEPDPSSSRSSSVSTIEFEKHKIFFAGLFVLELTIRFLFFTMYLMAIGCHLYAFLQTPMDDPGSPEFIAAVISVTSCIILNLWGLFHIALLTARKCNMKKPLPFIGKFFAPFTLTCAVRALLEVKDTQETEISSVGAVKLSMAYIWLYYILFSMVFCALGFCIRTSCSPARCCRDFGNFVYRNFHEEGVSKKAIRLFDTIGSMLCLVGLIFGMTSIFIDQYDLNFEPQGFVKDVVEVCDDFQEGFRPIKSVLKDIIRVLDKQFTCEHVYSTLAGGAAVGLFAGFFPGASQVVNVGARSAYYGVRTANAMTNLARKLKKSLNLLWQIVSAVRRIQKFTFDHLKGIIVSMNGPSLIKFLPFLPPVIVGLYVLYGAFWPKRILFFSAKQRRKTMAGMLYTWILVLIGLIFTVCVNTIIIDELVRLLNENLPLASATLNRKLGWTLSMSASGFAILGSLAYLISSCILVFQTNKNHENITNAELDWKAELEKRELVSIQTAMGEKLNRRTQIKYQKERIGPWTWVLPILICLIACGFGVLANLYPKFEMAREPKGTFGRVIDRFYRKFMVFEDDMYRVKNDTDMECLPYATLDDVIDERGSGILMRPVNTFFNATDKLLRPVREVFAGIRRQLFLDLEEELWGETLGNIWRENDLQYIGMLLMIPRAIGLLILIFGWLTSGIWVCQMRIIQAIEPRRLVSAFGKVTLFSVIYVLGAQLAIFNFLSTFGIPFYHVTVRFALGFIYDIVADSIMVSVYIGMNNEFFFAIPKRKVQVYYEVPGASDEGPNIPGKIL